MSYMPLVYIIAPIIVALIIFLIRKKESNALYFFIQALMFICFCTYFVTQQSQLTSFYNIGGWDTSIGITLKTTPLSIMFIFSGLFLWSIVGIYSWSKYKNDYKYYFFLLFAQSAYMGVVQTDDFFNFFVFLELLTIVATILIIYKKDSFALKAGLNYLLINSFGMIFFLIGLMLLYGLYGSVNISTLQTQIANHGPTNIEKLSYAFMIGGLCIKAAFFPVYNWLPKAHSAAPAPISALLSGIIVKTGILGFITTIGVFSNIYINYFFLLIGILSGLVGGIFALSQKDIKQLLAYSTVSQIGIILIGISGVSYVGGILHLFNHMIFKSLLFLCAGLIINHYKNRHLYEIRGVLKTMPFVAVFMIVGMLAITGAPLTNGYFSKSFIQNGLKNDSLLYVLFYIINLLSMIAYIKLGHMLIGEPLTPLKKNNKFYGTLFVLATTCILTVFTSEYAVQLLDSQQVIIINLFDLSKWINYMIMLVLSLTLYKFVVYPDLVVVKKIRHLRLSFRMSNILFLGFISVLLIVSMN